MTPPKYTGENPERYAVWDAHNGICSYCGKFHEFDKSEIDHIIPQRLNQLNQYEHGNELFNILKEISKIITLPNEFAIDTFYNVTLSCSCCNKKKGGKVRDIKEIVYFLREARDIYPQVINKYKKQVRHRSKHQISNILYSALKNGTITGDDIDDIKLIACDKFNYHVLVEMDAWKETSLITLGISGDVDDIYGFEIAFDLYKENNKIKAPNKDRNATLYLMSTMNQQMYKKQYLYTRIIDRSNGNLLLLPGKPPEIQLLLPPVI